VLETKSKIRWEEREDYYLEEVEKIISVNEKKAGSLIRILKQSQDLVGYITPEIIETVSSRLAIPASQAYGVVSFYNFFTMVPKGKHIIQVCTGTSCYVKGGKNVLDAFRKKLGLAPRGITEDGLFSLETVRCLGACGLSPVMSIDGEIHGRVKPNNLEDILNAYK
jgi:NADH:ubiquinone oxidoreductase subunit E